MPRILIIEDDTDINNSTATYLERHGCICLQAFSGTEGRRLFREGGVDLLLIDRMLPGLSGDELMTEVRAASQVPVIVLSARDGLSDKVDLFGLGADDYLTKPFELEAPDEALGQGPGQAAPFSNYSLVVEHPEYFLATFEQLQVFPGIETVQNVPLVPLPQPSTGGNFTDPVVVTPQPL